MTRMIGYTMADRLKNQLSAVFGERLQTDVPLARFTSTRVGGPADALLRVDSSGELVEVATRLWELEAPFLILGGGSNVLVSDAGVRGVVVLNHAGQVRFDEQGTPPAVWAESGANFGLIARKAASKGLSGLEWAAGVPGTLGGAIIGNAGAHSGDLAGNLVMAEILHQEVQEQANGSNQKRRPIREQWPVERMAYEYRSSILKRQHQTLGQQKDQGMPGIQQPDSIVLSGLLRLEVSTPQAVQAKMDEYSEKRRRTQPPGASMGSMFKNPPGDYAGRLIEACGLKGRRIGDAEISSLHANFFINRGQATAADIYSLILAAQEAVFDTFGIRLELEIERIGVWKTG